MLTDEEITLVLDSNGLTGVPPESFEAVRKLLGAIVELGYDEERERRRFEAATYEFYLRKRVARKATGGPPIFMDAEGDVPVAPEQMFARHANGNYVVIIYQAAWSGWKMARGG